MNIDELLKIYCDMTVGQAESLLALHKGERISDHQFESFLDDGLILPANVHGQAHTATLLGGFVLARAASILSGSFTPPLAPNFTAAEVAELLTNHAKFARMAMPLHYGLNSSPHIKGLVRVAIYPGVAQGAVIKFLQLAAGWQPMNVLMEQGMVICREPNILSGSRYAPLYPTDRGLMVLNWCLSQEDGA